MTASVSSVSGPTEAPHFSLKSILHFHNLHNFCNLLTLLLQSMTVPENRGLRVWFWGSLCFPPAKTDSLILVFLFCLLDSFEPQ